MSKITKKAAAIVFAIAIMASSVCAVFTGCATNDPSEPDGPSNTSTAVYSNGGTAVQYGDYVYFINGIPDYTDESGTTNVAGSVVKGGIYRTTIDWDRPDTLDEARNAVLEEYADDARFADPDNEGDTGFDEDDYERSAARSTTLYDVLDFEHEILDYIQLGEYTIGNEDGSEQPTYTDSEGRTRQNFVPTAGEAGEWRVTSERVVSKKVGTSGYDGGFWIYDNIIYFASPSTDHDTEGNVEYDRTSFWAYNLGTGSLTELYTATEVNNALPYAYYKVGDYVYLATFERYYANADDEEAGVLTGYIVINRISGTNVVDNYELMEGVTDAYFYVSETYIPDENETSANNFIYFTRENTSDDNNPDGVTLEMVPVDASQGQEDARYTIDTATTGSISVLGLEGGYLYYTKTLASGSTGLLINSLYAQLHEYDDTYVYDPADPDSDIAPPMNEFDPVLCSDTSEYTTILPIPQDSNDMKAPCFMGANSNGIYRVTATGRTQVYNGTITLVGYNDGRIYCTLETTDEETEDDTTTDDEDSSGTVTAFVSASAYQDFTYQTATILNIGVAPTTTPFSIDFVTLDFGAVTGATADTEETYVSYFGTYGGSMTDYMYLNKVSGRWESASTVNLMISDVVYSEKPAITCYDHNCLNFLHDHSSWDDYTEDEEEGSTEGGVMPDDSTFT